MPRLSPASITERVDGVFTSMEAMYPAGKTAPPEWDAPAASPISLKANELLLPEGPRP
jgi:hypothetical protein